MMRIKRTTLILGLLIIIWSSIFYLTYYYHPVHMYSEIPSKLSQQIVILEQDISREFLKNNVMIKDAQKILEIKKENENYQHSMDLYEFRDVKIPVLVFACNRITVTKCLDSLIQYRTRMDQFPIIVSQDCNHTETKKAILKYRGQVSLIEQPDQSEIQVPPKEKKLKGYFKIARHYGWALNQIFFKFNFSAVIIVEDDLEVSPDFFEYFLGLYSLLLKDSSLWCISAWNDNGKESLINLKRPDLLYRTDFFPGLGWMLTKNIWLELYQKWPRAYWDDWIRDPLQRKGRSCIRPEISRTRTFGKIGVSNGMFFEKHLKYIKLNEEFVSFTKQNLTYLQKENYDIDFVKKVYQSPVIGFEDLNQVKFNTPVRLIYRTREEYKTITKKLGLMDDFKSGIPRTSYKGIVTFHYNGIMVHFTPSNNWKGYDVSWS
ncbi:alpha-1,3-mannosyl-glycoprotein 2-beta-N-acetylglucosaminyltransferase isoform X1 [Diabrotica undecimpunctata]|uniref:alpha-1,3-mannosyl-glycoprotein 2-beta-N-acetylglucosaminyltransferase isoform X1 n=1 Tax=Diabrotica undecimpunctata TaxID=50387 RepID=UPI003B638B1E